MLRSRPSPSRTWAWASFSCTAPARSDFTSEPCSTIPASIFSSRLKRKPACRLVATSPGAALRFFFFAIGLRVCRGRGEIHPATGGLDAVHHHAHWVAEAQPAPRVLVVECRAELVQGPPAPQAAAREQALEAVVAEADEGALLHKPHHLALEDRRLHWIGVRQPPFEQEGQAHVVRRALDLHRLALGRRGRHARLVELVRRRGRVVDAEALQESPVRHDVRVAPDRRREVAVTRAREAGVAAGPPPGAGGGGSSAPRSAGASRFAPRTAPP